MLKKKINFLMVIPARYKSKRFPGKPLAKIKGIPMLKRTYIQCLKATDKKNIVIAKKAAAYQFTKIPITNTEPKDITIPKVNASDLGINPSGIGRLIVLFIFLSISASYHIFKTPDAPAPVAIQSSAIKAVKG